ncbi:MAG: hypothetical protein NVV82_23010 [Sporocytophaga sp.]|nr:hypothetical protein [Sporocytophaga sp.]
MNLQVAFMNKFPVLFPDSEGYILKAFTGSLSWDKPHTYSFLVKNLSFSISLWPIIIVQSTIMSYLLYCFFKTFKVSNAPLATALASIVLSFTTGFSLYTSQIMPDIFAAASILSLFLIFYQEDFSRWNKIILTTIFILSAMTHVSHSFTGILTLSVFTIINYFFLPKSLQISYTIRRLVFCFGLSIAPLVLVPLFHYSLSQEFFVTKTSHTFFMARMAENGILDKYLNDNCDKENLKLCQYKGAIPNSGAVFLWDSNSPVYLTDGWYDKDSEYKKIIKSTLTHPKYLSLHIQESIKATFKQLFNFESGDGTGPVIISSIKENFPLEYREYMNSEQFSGQLNFNALNYRQHFILLISLIIISSFLFVSELRITSYYIRAILFIFMGIFFNAFVTGTLSGVYWRYQGRVIWLIPLVVLALVFKYRKDLTQLMIKETKRIKSIKEFYES